MLSGLIGNVVAKGTTDCFLKGRPKFDCTEYKLFQNHNNLGNRGSKMQKNDKNYKNFFSRHTLRD